MRPRRFLAAVLRMGPYLWSHHPHCGPFAADVLRLRGRRLCTACFIGYPAIAASLALLCVAAPTSAPAWTWLVAGALLAAPQAASFAGRVRAVPIQVAIKVGLGSGIGLVAFGLLALPVALPFRVALLALALVVTQSFWVLRLHRLERTCRACPQLASRPRCEGLRDLDDRVGALVRLPPPHPASARGPPLGGVGERD